MAEHEITVTILTDAEYQELQKRAKKQRRDETQQLNTEVERILTPKITRAMGGTRRGARQAA